MITWAHCMFSQIRSLSYLIYREFPVPQITPKSATVLIAAKLCCDSGHDPQTATFPQMPSITDFQVCYHGFALGSWVHRVGKFIKNKSGPCEWIRTTALQIFVPLQLSLLIADLWSGLSLHHDISVLDDRR